jgi:cyclopropane fatty-acyl-phospholipid synthase-like methyltransferase
VSFGLLSRGARERKLTIGHLHRSVDFIQKHIFPGGFLPSVTCLVDSLLAGSKGKLVVEQIENIGPRALLSSTIPYHIRRS